MVSWRSLRTAVYGSMRAVLVGWSGTRRVSPERPPVAAIGLVSRF